ncbi:MAG: ubiquinol-cytochrome c reductase iron-sulfur subunit [Fidelibacterota bacterium]
MNWLLGIGFVGVLIEISYPVSQYLVPPKDQTEDPSTIKAGSVQGLKPNSDKIVRFGRKPAIIIKTIDGKIKAFSAVCTHLNCTVQYQPDLRHIWCACQ